jgi:hypothetical protein
VEETHKMLARNLPGINFSYGPNYDSNSFLVNNSWNAGAVRLSANLISILSIPEQLRRGQIAEDTAITRRQALSMATLAKVHIAYQQYLAASKEYRWADQLASVDRKLYQQISNRTETDAQSELEKVSAHVSTVQSDLRRFRSYAEAQAALGRLYNAIGVDPVPDQVEALDIASLTAIIRRSASDWENNRLDQLSEAASPAPKAAPTQDIASTPPVREPVQRQSALQADGQPVAQ